MKAAVLVLALLATPAIPCSAFLVVGSDRVLFGNNEDYLNPNTQVRFVPAKEGRHGVMYLGFDDGFPQGGMNDAGLAFDGFATESRPMSKQGGKTPVDGNPIVEAMETCSTVDEVSNLLETIDLRPLLTNAMLFFADASGDSIIIEGDQFLRKGKEEDFQVITNFYQSAHEDDLAQCPRYAAAVRTLEARKETSEEVCTRALSAAAQRGNRVATLYSNVFDLKARTAKLYLFHDYGTPVTLNLEEELAKGERTLRLPDLFPPNARFEAYVAYSKLSIEQRIAERKGPKLTVEALERWTGLYDLEIAGTIHQVQIERKDNALLARSAIFTRSDGQLELHSASPTEFFSIRASGELTLTFEQDSSGKVTGLTLSTGGVQYPATVRSESK